MATVGSVKINLVMGQIGQHGNVTNCIRVNLKKRVKTPDILHPTSLDLGVHGGPSPWRFSKR